MSKTIKINQIQSIDLFDTFFIRTKEVFIRRLSVFVNKAYLVKTVNPMIGSFLYVLLFVVCKV